MSFPLKWGIYKGAPFRKCAPLFRPSLGARGCCCSKAGVGRSIRLGRHVTKIAMSVGCHADQTTSGPPVAAEQIERGTPPTVPTPPWVVPQEHCAARCAANPTDAMLRRARMLPHAGANPFVSLPRYSNAHAMPRKPRPAFARPAQAANPVPAYLPKCLLTGRRRRTARDSRFPRTHGRGQSRARSR